MGSSAITGFRRYEFGLFDFGGGADETFAVIGLKGKTGQLFDYGVCGVIEAFNGDTLDPQISVGTVADPDAYGEEFSLDCADNTAKSVRSTYGHVDQIEVYVLPGVILPADTVVVLKCLAATGANQTGQGYPFMEILWDL